MSTPKLPESFDLHRLAAELGIKTQAGEQALIIALENVLLLDGKQLDYGPQNIAKWGTFGVVVRMTDKFERIHTLYNKGRRKRAVNESIRDTFRDISNYAIIALLCDMKKWPTLETTTSPTSKSQ